LPGDMLGLENGPAHRFTADAVVETKVLITKRLGLLDTVTHQELGAKKLLGFVTRNLQHAENHMLLLGRKTALERVAAFLLEINERLDYPNVMIMRMSRRDIVDYLGLTIETVSRALSSLRDENLLQFCETTQRQLALLNRIGLAQLDT